MSAQVPTGLDAEWYISFYLMDFFGATASFDVLHVGGTDIVYFISDISQTIDKIVVRATYAPTN